MATALWDAEGCNSTRNSFSRSRSAIISRNSIIKYFKINLNMSSCFILQCDSRLDLTDEVWSSELYAHGKAAKQEANLNTIFWSRSAAARVEVLRNVLKLNAFLHT
jgi:hypothetical protein